MREEHQESHEKSWQIGPQYLLFALVSGILVLSSVAFIRPIFIAISTNTESTSNATVQEIETVTPESALTPTPDSEALPPTPEEIGYTDGIIIWSTVLMLLLLAGTLYGITSKKSKK